VRSSRRMGGPRRGGNMPSTEVAKAYARAAYSSTSWAGGAWARSKNLGRERELPDPRGRELSSSTMAHRSSRKADSNPT